MYFLIHSGKTICDGDHFHQRYHLLGARLIVNYTTTGLSDLPDLVKYFIFSIYLMVGNTFGKIFPAVYFAQGIFGRIFCSQIITKLAIQVTCELGMCKFKAEK